MRADTVTELQLECADLREEVAYLKRKMSNLEADMEHQERLEDLNRLLLKNALMELESARERAELASDAKTEFLANMSHEIRTPLNIILGMGEMLESTRLSSKQRQFVSKGQEAGQHLLGLINNILEFSRIENGTIVLDSSPFDLNKLAANLAGVYETLCEKKKLEFTFEFDARLKGFFVGDESKIRQILHNLLGNAIKFTDKGGVTFSIFKSGAASCAIVFQVIDSGVGISKEYQRDVFDRFNQIERIATKSHQGGVGLGLAIAKLLVQKMKGDITLESAFGQGSAFTVKLPLETVCDPSLVTSRGRARSVDYPELDGMAVLVADDVPGNLYVVEHYLDCLGVEVSYAGGGKRAVELYTLKKFDMVLMDISMPDMDGVAAFKAIRRHEAGNGLKQTPIIAMTAHAFQEIRESLFREGFNGILTKPFSRDDLLATLSGPHDEGREPARNHIETSPELSVPASLEPLIPLLMESLTAERKRIAKALESGQYKEMIKLCHANKGVAGMYGFKRLMHMFENLEHTVREGEYLEAASQMRDLTDYLDRIEKVFSAVAEGIGG